MTFPFKDALGYQLQVFLLPIYFTDLYGPLIIEHLVIFIEKCFVGWLVLPLGLIPAPVGEFCKFINKWKE